MVNDCDITIFATNGRALTINTAIIPAKSTRTTVGVQAMVLRGTHTVTHACYAMELSFTQPKRYVSHSIPSIGALLKDEDKGHSIKPKDPVRRSGSHGIFFLLLSVSVFRFRHTMKP